MAIKVINKIVKGDFDIAIFMGNMSIISTWIGAIIVDFTKKGLFWTHGLYGNESFIKKIRILFLRLANKNILYEDRAKEMLIKEGFNKNNLEVIYNSLNYDLQLEIFKKLEKNNFSNKLFQIVNCQLLFLLDD